MDLSISNIPSHVEAKTVKQAVVSFVTSNKNLAPLTYSCLLDIRVELGQSESGKAGKGVLTFPTPGAGRQFLSLFAFYGLSLKIRESEIFFAQISNTSRLLLTTANKTRVPSKKVVNDPRRDLRVLVLQFGVFYRPRGYNPKVSRSFSVEWERKFLDHDAAWLGVESALLRIRAGGPLSSSTMTTFVVTFPSIRKLAMGYDGDPYICFDLEHPSTIEESAVYLSLTEDRQFEGQRPKHRVRHFHDGLTRVAPFAHHIRVILFKDNNVDVVDYLSRQLMNAGLDAARIVKFTGVAQIDAHKGNLYSDRQLRQLYHSYYNLSWVIVFQLESLLRNGVFHATDLSKLATQIQNAYASPQHAPLLVVTVLRELCRMSTSGSLREPLLQCFSRLYSELESIDPAGPDTFLCHYITFTPTRSFLRGPFPTRSNRIIRKYPGFEDHFIRVAFRDEDLLPYRESSEVDVNSLIRECVGSILSQGFDVGGRHYEFLGYSMAGFRNHSVWFMSSFSHSDFGDVTPHKIRSSLGNFERVSKSPSMYGARLAQAFTSTVPTVLIGPEEWDLVEDLGLKPYQFTDGAGTISKSLGREIWSILRSQGLCDGLEPSAYQIRFKEFKGVLTVDAHLDETGGIRMRLRKSMKKFETTDETADLEIVKAFDRPHGCYLNRSIILILENLGVDPNIFVELQKKAVSDILDSDELSEPLHRMMEDRRLGHAFRLSSTIKQTIQLIRQSEPKLAERFLASPFAREVAQVVKSTVLQDIKYGARVPIPGSFLLVGVPDEGPAYEKVGQKNVFTLQPGQIYACIQYPEDLEPTLFSGPFLIFRSPVMHPGDVQKVYAIGKPPENMFCAFAHLKNVVVLPSVGTRSLASCLGGGDLDGDTYSLVSYEPLFPPIIVDPAEYCDSEPAELSDKRDAEAQDICDFVVDFMTCDVLGQLSDRLLDVLDSHSVGPKNRNWTMLADMCAKAADYPKRGNPVIVDYEKLPRSTQQRKPDWRRTSGLNDTKGYYTSTSALGHMFRSISNERELPRRSSGLDPQLASISPVIRSLVEQYIVPSDGDVIKLAALFSKYVCELNYIRYSHSLSIATERRLSEAEIVAGTILSRDSPKQWRTRRIDQMNVHAAALVGDVRRALHVPCDLSGAGREELLRALGSGWEAWNYVSLRDVPEDGVGSFSLIVLGVVLDCHRFLSRYTR